MAGNPLRSEAAAFHWVLGTLLVIGLVVVASWLSTWLGIAVVALLVAAAAWWLLASLRKRPPPRPGGRADVEDTPD